ncbi:hypothetical protein C8R43DRAFT_1071627 [Mycena crocata]|nr:hypothetical protein C8R43DRAFT_1071627 [Mycena crocata]
MLPRKAFTGPTRKLVLGMDLGTTYAGMSYSLLEPGKIPSILPVTRFPAQDHVGGDSKVPSVIYYDRFGSVRAVGAEALQESVVEKAEEEGWVKSEWFKLHLRPNDSNSIQPNHLPPLPVNKTVVDIFADFLRYLFQCAKTYIADHYQNGSALWIALEDSIEFVLTHPNGWEGEQQSKMRKAAIIAGLIPNNRDGHDRIHFVTEGEASLHFCITNGLATDPLRLGKGVIIVDAGGGTVDISAYRKLTSAKGNSFEEIARAQCLFKGSIFVSNRAQEHLKNILQGSKYAGDVEHIRDCFDKVTKLRFRSTDEWSYIKFGRPRDRDEALNITNGQLKLSSAVVARFFKPSLDAIVVAITNQSRTSTVPISSVLLVGGFAASEWLYAELKKRMNLQGLQVSRPDSHVNKAVADGAVSFYLDRFVSTRISKHTYGIEVSEKYQATNAEHIVRAKYAARNAAGDLMIPKAFSSILTKNTSVSEMKEFRMKYVRSASDRSQLYTINEKILCYNGMEADTRWTDSESEKYAVVCTVHADTTAIAQTLPRQQGSLGAYYSLKFDIILSFGLTELKAQIAWVENGKEKRGPAEILY